MKLSALKATAEKKVSTKVKGVKNPKPYTKVNNTNRVVIATHVKKGEEGNVFVNVKIYDPTLSTQVRPANNLEHVFGNLVIANGKRYLTLVPTEVMNQVLTLQGKETIVNAGMRTFKQLKGANAGKEITTEIISQRSDSKLGFKIKAKTDYAGFRVADTAAAGKSLAKFLGSNLIDKLGKKPLEFTLGTVTTLPVSVKTTTPVAGTENLGIGIRYERKELSIPAFELIYKGIEKVAEAPVVAEVVSEVATDTVAR